jgi:hypothetical protein
MHSRQKRKQILLVRLFYLPESNFDIIQIQWGARNDCVRFFSLSEDPLSDDPFAGFALHVLVNTSHPEWSFLLHSAVPHKHVGKEVPGPKLSTLSHPFSIVVACKAPARLVLPSKMPRVHSASCLLISPRNDIFLSAGTPSCWSKYTMKFAWKQVLFGVPLKNQWRSVWWDGSINCSNS